MITKKRSKIIDIHTVHAVNVADSEYFVVHRESLNQNQGLLVGTEVRKHRGTEPVASPSRFYGKGAGNPISPLYWTIQVEAPNGQLRTVCCDVLEARKDSSLFTIQKLAFNRSLTSIGGLSRIISTNFQTKKSVS